MELTEERKSWILYTLPQISVSEDNENDEFISDGLEKLTSILENLDCILTVSPSLIDVLGIPLDTYITDLCKNYGALADNCALLPFESEDSLSQLLVAAFLDSLVGSLGKVVETYDAIFANLEKQGRSKQEKAPKKPVPKQRTREPKTRPNIPREAKEVLVQWFRDHLGNTYPNMKEKERLSVTSGLTIKKIENWFINERSRKWHLYMQSHMNP